MTAHQEAVTATVDSVERALGLAWFGINAPLDRAQDESAKYRALAIDLERDLTAAREALEAKERECGELKQSLWDIYGALGCDQDGDKTPAALTYPPLTELVLEAAKEASRDYCSAIEENSRHLAKLATAEAALAGVRDYAEYGRRVLEAHRDEIGDIDGGWLQDVAIECGLLHEVDVSEPCGEVCNCLEYGEFPGKCLRLKQPLPPSSGSPAEGAS